MFNIKIFACLLHWIIPLYSKALNIKGFLHHPFAITCESSMPVRGRGGGGAGLTAHPQST